MSTKIEISKRLILINSFSGILTKILNITVLVWLHRHLLVSKYKISDDEYSIYPLMVSMMVFLPLLASIFTSGLSRYAVEAYAREDQNKVSQITTTMFIVLLVFGLFIWTSGLAFTWHIDSILTIEPQWLDDARIMMTLMITAFVIRTALSPFLVGFHIRQKFVLQNLIDISGQFLRIAILFTLLFGVSTRVLWVVVSSVSANLIGLAVTFVMSRQLVPALRFRPSHFKWPIAKEIISFGSWTFLASLADRIRMSVDIIILNKLSTPLEMNCFYLGTMPQKQIQGLSSVAHGPLMPALTAMYATGSKNKLSSAYLRGGRISLWLILSISVPLIIYAQPFVSIWVGMKYQTAATVIMLILATYPLIYGNVMMSSIAIAMAKVRTFAILALSIQIMNLLLTLYLVGVKGMGAVGSALSTFLTMLILYPATNITLGLHLAEVSFKRWLIETIWPGWLPALASTVLWLLLKVSVQPSTWFSLAVCITIGLICYMTILFLFCLQPQDRKDFQKVLTALKSKYTWMDKKSESPS